MRNYALLISLLFTRHLYALSCPDNSKAPLCPKSGTTLLDETYPTQAFVISDSPIRYSNESKRITERFVYKIIENYDYQNVPQILLPVTFKQNFQDLIANLRKTLEEKGIEKEKIETILGQISRVDLPSYNWQQDWFESFINPKTGSPVIRQMGSYKRVSTGSSAKLSEMAKQCGVENGQILTENFGKPKSIEDIKKYALSFGSGEAGGNIEGAPGGFCLTGDNLGKAFANQFCGPEENVIKLQTSWLAVGHVDELFKIIPTQYNDGRPKECEFSLMAASPKKALELMASAKGPQTSFVSLDPSTPLADIQEKKEGRTFSDWEVNKQICRYISEAILKNPEEFKKMPAKTRSVFLNLLFGNEAFAQKRSPNEQDCYNNIDKITNFQMQELMKSDSQFMELNSAIENSVQKDKELIKSKILSRLPQCSPYYNELDVPNIFYGGSLKKNSDGTLSLQQPGKAMSFLPNPTNSVLMNKTVIFPDSENDLYNQYLKEELKKRKIKSDFIPTWDYAHLGLGNLHCVSHSLTYCRPNK